MCRRHRTSTDESYSIAWAIVARHDPILRHLVVQRLSRKPERVERRGNASPARFQRGADFARFVIGDTFGQRSSRGSIAARTCRRLRSGRNPRRAGSEPGTHSPGAQRAPASAKDVVRQDDEVWDRAWRLSPTRLSTTRLSRCGGADTSPPECPKRGPILADRPAGSCCSATEGLLSAESRGGG